MAKRWKMDEMQELLDQQLVKAVEELGLKEDEFERVASDTFQEALAEVETAFEEDLSAREQGMLTERRADLEGFVQRNRERWRAGFDKLERLIVMSEELGGAVSFALGEIAVRENDPMFEATISLHARAVLISREVLCLMVNGFPDGALGRWRTLHEVGIAAQFIGHHGRETAERFLAHRHWLANERAKQYKRYSERAGLSPMEAGSLERLDQIAQAVRSRYGEEIESDYGWAYPALRNKRPKLIHLEEDLGLDHWRPRYRWASMSTHSTYQTPIEGLGMSEAKQPVRLVGPSNSGMTDPAHMTALTLNLATLPVVMLEPNLDRLAIQRVMLKLSNEIGDTFLELQKRSMQDAQ